MSFRELYDALVVDAGPNGSTKGFLRLEDGDFDKLLRLPGQRADDAPPGQVRRYRSSLPLGHTTGPASSEAE